MKRAYKYRFYPSNEQAALLCRTFGCVRLVWNLALAERTRLYAEQSVRTSYVDTAKWLTAWKREAEFAFLQDVSNVPLQQALRHQQAAFNNFFAKRARYPKFKSLKSSRASATFASNAFSFRNGELKLAKMDQPLEIRWSRELPDGLTPSTVTVSRDAGGRWFVALLVEERVAPLPATGATIGIDAGLSALVTLSTGEKIANPKHERADRAKLAKAQRVLCRKQPDSSNREKARARVARIHTRIADRRRDHLHKLTTRLVRENQALAIEDLAVRNMLKNRTLARAISDASWSTLRGMMEYKADWYGREILVVDRFFPSSRLCSTPGCAWELSALPLGIRTWACPNCGTMHDRDVNAARNILAAGLAER